jgi:hypothetical protein
LSDFIRQLRREIVVCSGGFMRVLPFLAVIIFLSPILLVAQTITPAASDPQAVTIVQQAINALGGTKAIGLLQSWTFQAQTEGRIANGPISEGLVSSIPAGTTVQTPPPWARPRSLFVPALVSAILVNESQDPKFSIKQAAPSPSVPNSAVVVFSVTTKSGTSVTAQRWYFDSTRNLPMRVEFMLPAKIGLIESFPSVVTLSNYQAIGGVLYPFQIETYLQSENAGETVTLQSVTPSTTVPSASNASPGGAQ